MKKMAIMVATGFEDTELIAAIDYWSRQSIEFQLFSVERKTQVKGAFFASVNTTPISEFDPLKFDSIFLPGGKGVSILESNISLPSILKSFDNDNKGIFAICAAPKILDGIDILKNKKFTCWPGLNLANSTGRKVEVDENVVTGRDFESTIEFAKEVAKYINSK